jgi:hypothetical protein
MAGGVRGAIAVRVGTGAGDDDCGVSVVMGASVASTTAGVFVGSGWQDARIVRIKPAITNLV